MNERDVQTLTGGSHKAVGGEPIHAASRLVVGSGRIAFGAILEEAIDDLKSVEIGGQWCIAA
jgi:hypothetical protein